MSDQKYTIGPIEVRWGRDRYRYYVIDEVFYSEWKCGLDFSKSSWPLRGASARLDQISGRSSGITKTIRIAMLLIACAVVVYFSDYHRSIPLLAPLLGLLGAWWFINALPQVMPRNWTLVRKLTGEDAFWVVQPDKRSDAWLRFEADLIREIERINGAEA